MRGRYQSGSWVSGGDGPCPKAIPLSHWYLLNLSIPLHPSPGSWLLRRACALQDGVTGNPKGGTIAFPQADIIWRGVPPKKDGICQCWRWTKHRGPGSCLYSCLPRATNPNLFSWDSSLLQLSQPEPRVSDCKWYFVCWAFIRVPVSLWLLFLYGRQNSHGFHGQVLCVCLFVGLMIWDGKPAWGWDPSSLGGTFVTEMSLCSLCPSYQSEWLL